MPAPGGALSVMPPFASTQQETTLATRATKLPPDLARAARRADTPLVDAKNMAPGAHAAPERRFRPRLRGEVCVDTCESLARDGHGINIGLQSDPTCNSATCTPTDLIQQGDWFFEDHTLVLGVPRP
jgi:hypothetical protein